MISSCFPNDTWRNAGKQLKPMRWPEHTQMKQLEASIVHPVKDNNRLE